MAVLDLLPNSVSGVYFMYHQDYAKWSFGKLSACREAALAKEGGYRYYNMGMSIDCSCRVIKAIPTLYVNAFLGYYIQSCPKMLYKMEYSPSDLLDPETYEWNPLNDDLKNLLNKSKYVCPSEIRARMHSGDNVVVNDKAKGIEEPGEEENETNEENDEVQDPGYVFKTKMPGLLTDRQLKEFDVGNVNIDVAGTRAQAKVMKRAISKCRIPNLIGKQIGSGWVRRRYCYTLTPKRDCGYSWNRSCKRDDHYTGIIDQHQL